MSNRFTAKKLAFAAMALALAFVTSFIKIIHMPMGGSVTLFSMFFITLIGYWFGPVVGIIAGLAYGGLQLAIDPYILSIPQLICDYFLAFGALGLSGFFWKMKARLNIDISTGKKDHLCTFTLDNMTLGYVVAVLGRYLFSFLSGWIFFGMYAPENFPNAVVYSLAYNGAYLGLEALITLFIITFITPVRKALGFVTKTALR